MTRLNARESATARSRAYLLLGRLFLRGVTGETVDHVRSVEPLAEVLPVYEDEGEVDFDEAAAAHQDVFGFNVFPFQSTYLDETARAGGDETNRVIDFYRTAGFPVVQKAESADHVGVQLNFLGFLSKLETETDAPERAREFGRRFLDEHLLRWLPALAHALDLHGDPLFSTLAQLALEFTTDHRISLHADSDSRPPPVSAPSDKRRAAGDELDLDDASTSLRDIAEWLLVPAHTGIFLSRASLRALSRRERLPAGFGSRSNMLTNLLRSAADYDGLEEVTTTLLEHVEDTRRFWRDFAERDPELLAPIAAPWFERLDHTEDRLDRIRDAYRKHSD